MFENLQNGKNRCENTHIESVFESVYHAKHVLNVKVLFKNVQIAKVCVRIYPT